MFRKRFYYVIKFQYLGFRYHGWQRQPNVITLQKMVERTIKFVLEHNNFKILAASRTDAKVSANEAYFELFVDHEPIEMDPFFELLNQNLPQDIRALAIEEVDEKFNIINAPKLKEYMYLFCVGEKFHPFAAPFMYNIIEPIDLESMKEAALLFEGKHDFKSYCHRPTPTTQTEGEIVYCRIEKNEIYTANFFPEESYVLRVKGAGFKRNQIRLMMGVLLDVGKGRKTINFVKKTLRPDLHYYKLEHIVPGSGLILNQITMS
ncbi:tRNA pseudouridine synthase A [Aquimarina brevivitae]|uniref:tRNA pseudouridine synthase A n=1 Tax=Aquimarina brevivitae TaxID=323412 RepID=A0A4Q7NTZ5_9FLAO|nr:tRNA pseudouridine(38-40) synthase TruA [Aquimarina brevivitae]RZS90641.1 tRNA pseudouridine38-40 synthase [Aquimarina brevivitae]